MTDPSAHGNAATVPGSSIPAVWQVARRAPERIAIIEPDGVRRAHNQREFARSHYPPRLRAPAGSWRQAA